MTADEMAPVVPRLAATVLVVREDPFEVLMLRRRAHGSFPSALVFPGGVVEPSDRDAWWNEHASGGDDLDADERALRVAAVRETWEESGILVASTGGDGESFRDRVGTIDLDAIHHFGHWITPEVRPKRWDTHFLLTRAPEGQIAGFDGVEMVSAEWVSPHFAVEAAESGLQPLLFPTLMSLTRLAESGGLDAAIEAARIRERFTVEPVYERRDGRRVIVIPAEAGYSQTEFPTGVND